uniref:Uncharacterized protein n=1 Tax=Anas zonorhyncha TaxID=75864 RepID=A0A8B9U4P9_9AVES
PALPTLQIIGGDAVGHLGGVERPFQPQLLGCQQPGLRIQVLDLLLELTLPEVNVLQPLAQGGCGILLGALSGGSGALAQLLGLIPVALGLLAAGEGPVVLAVVALVPLGGQVLGAAEAGRGQAAGGVGPGFQRRLVHLGGQRGDGHRRRRGVRPECRPPGPCVCLWQPAGAATPLLAPGGHRQRGLGFVVIFWGLPVLGWKARPGAQRWVLQARGQQRALSSLRCGSLSSKSFLSRK